MPPTEKEFKEAILLLENAHYRLLETQQYGIDILAYRTIQLLGAGLPDTPNQEI